MYQPKDAAVASRQLVVQRLSIPFTVTHNASPASKTMTVDEPSLVFFNFQGITQLSTSTGAIETGEILPTLATATDSTGVFNVLIKIREPLVKVCAVYLIGRGSSSLMLSGQPLAFTTGSTNSGQSIVANIPSGVNLSTTDVDACLCVEYTTVE